MEKVICSTTFDGYYSTLKVELRSFLINNVCSRSIPNIIKIISVYKTGHGGNKNTHIQTCITR